MIARRARIAAAGIALVVLTALSIILFSRAGAGEPFSHLRHAEAGVVCEVCHANVRRESFAGIPTTETCRMCHKDAPDRVSPATESPRTNLPDHVFFSHRRHVGVALLDCGVCHGGVGTSNTMPRKPLITLSMDFCMSCHETAHVSQDCIACHR